MKAIRLTEEEYAAALKRSAKLVAVGVPVARHKFGAEKTDGYDSKLEAKRAGELVLLQRANVISELRMQHAFVLLDAQYGPTGELWERSATYIADYVYVKDGRMVVEDCKGYRKGAAYKEYVLKRKLLLARYGLRVIEITRS